MAGFKIAVTVAEGDLTFTLPLYNRGTFNCVVYWGDTTNSTITAYDDADRVHTYPSTGTYEIEITGACPAWSFNNGGDRLKLTDIVYWGDSGDFGGFSYLAGGFFGCSNLASFGTGSLGDRCTLVTDFSYTFCNCAGLTGTIPSFAACTLVTDFSYTFLGCSGLTGTIPSFAACTLVTDFSYTFCNCAGLTGTIPSFAACTLVTSFSATFYNCTGLTGTIPSFAACTLVTDFSYTFCNCSGLTGTIPSFAACTLVTDFFATFYNCTGLTGTIPSFAACTLVTSFSATFLGCSGLTLLENCFYEQADKGTRFLNKTVSFSNCFNRSTATGSQGVAPDLWNCNFGTGTPTTDDCFSGDGNSATSLENYKNIPTAWGGAPVSAPTITDIDTDENVLTNQTNVAWIGTNNLPYQYEGVLYLSDSATPGSGTMVPQTIVDWSDTGGHFNVVQGTLSAGIVYAHLTTDRGDQVASGLAITLTAAQQGWQNVIEMNGIATSGISKINGISVSGISKLNGIAV